MKCDFCKKEGSWQEDKFKTKVAAQTRSLTIGAHFPWNVKVIPTGCNFDKDSLIRNGVVSRHACPACYRA